MGIVRARNVIFYMFRCVVVCLVLLCSTPAINKFDSFGRGTQKCISMGRLGERDGRARGTDAAPVESNERWKIGMRDWRQAMESPATDKRSDSCEEMRRKSLSKLRKCFHTRSAVGISHPLFPNFPKTRLCSPHYQLRSALKSFLRPRQCSVI